MKLRFVLLALVFAILALAGISHDCAPSIEAHHGGGEATRLTAPLPASEADIPVIVRASATTPASAQTILDFNPRLHIARALELSTAGRQVPVERGHDVLTPQSFPLLI
ncbi:MAG TPA: hypothetical protein VMT00_11610 [Thermoanaerobaculia bacterium]|nr:hypothetical protein [Thermoanaerobaculia bacterium]